MTPPIVLVNKAHVTLMNQEHVDESLAFACGKCGTVMSSHELAEKHCDPTLCEDCGKETSQQYYTHCDSCRYKRRCAKTAKLAEEAKKISIDDYGGYVYVEDEDGIPFTNADCGEGFHSSAFQAAEDIWDSCDEGVPETFYVWGTLPKMLNINAEDLIDSELEEHHENAEVDNDSIKELQKFLDIWCKEQDITTYETDYGVLVTGVQEAVKQMEKEK